MHSHRFIGTVALAAFGAMAVACAAETGTETAAVPAKRAEANIFSARQCDVASARPTPSPFTDTEGHWAEHVIGAMAELGLVSGFGDGTFRPEDTLKRREWAALLYQATGLAETAERGEVTERTREFFAGIGDDALLEAALCEGPAAAGADEELRQCGSTYRTCLGDDTEAFCASIYRACAEPWLRPENSSVDAPVWYHRPACAMLHLGVIAGDDKGQFNYQQDVTIAEVWASVVELLRLPLPASAEGLDGYFEYERYPNEITREPYNHLRSGGDGRLDWYTRHMMALLRQDALVLDHHGAGAARCAPAIRIVDAEPPIDGAPQFIQSARRGFAVAQLFVAMAANGAFPRDVSSAMCARANAADPYSSVRGHTRFEGVKQCDLGR